MYQSIPAAPIPPPPSFAYLVSPGCGALANFVWPRGQGIWLPWDHPKLLTRTILILTTKYGEFHWTLASLYTDVALFSFRSFRKHRRAWKARKKNKHDSDWSIFFLPHYYPLALAVNKSPAAFIFLSHARRTLKRKKRVWEQATDWQIGSSMKETKILYTFFKRHVFAILCMRFFIALLVWSCMINLLLATAHCFHN